VNDLLLLAKSLQEENHFLKNGCKSTRSYTAPSHDIGRSNSKSLREKSGKPSGGQIGHKGSTLLMKSDPDQIIEHRPYFC